MTDQQEQEPVRSSTFHATFPGTQSAISAHGEGGMRIILEIPESDMAEAIQLLVWRGRNLEVTIKPLPKQTFGGGFKRR